MAPAHPHATGVAVYPALFRYACLHYTFYYKHAHFWAEAERALQNLIFEAEMCLNACLSFISK